MLIHGLITLTLVNHTIGFVIVTYISSQLSQTTKFKYIILSKKNFKYIRKKAVGILRENRTQLNILFHQTLHGAEGTLSFLHGVNSVFPLGGISVFSFCWNHFISDKNTVKLQNQMIIIDSLFIDELASYKKTKISLL